MRTDTHWKPWGTRTFYSNGEYIDRAHDGTILEPDLMPPGPAFSRRERDRQENLAAHGEQNRILGDIKTILNRLHREMVRLEGTPGPVVSGRRVTSLKRRVEKLGEDVEALIHPDGDDSD